MEKKKKKRKKNMTKITMTKKMSTMEYTTTKTKTKFQIKTTFRKRLHALYCIWCKDSVSKNYMGTATMGRNHGYLQRNSLLNISSRKKNVYPKKTQKRLHKGFALARSPRRRPHHQVEATAMAMMIMSLVIGAEGQLGQSCCHFRDQHHYILFIHVQPQMSMVTTLTVTKLMVQDPE